MRLLAPQATSGASVNGFWQLRLAAPVTSVQITYFVSGTVPVADNAQFTVSFQVVSPAGVVGPAAIQTLTKVKNTTFTGPFNGQRTATQTFTGDTAPITCTWLTTFTVTLKITLQQRSDGTVSGNAEMNGSETTAVTGAAGCSSQSQSGPRIFPFTVLPVTGTAGNIMVSGQNAGGADASNVVTNTFVFSGALNGGVVSGTATYAISGRTVSGRTVIDISGSQTIPVTLK
jgi:hypothetical protein